MLFNHRSRDNSGERAETEAQNNCCTRKSALTAPLLNGAGRGIAQPPVDGWTPVTGSANELLRRGLILKCGGSTGKLLGYLADAVTREVSGGLLKDVTRAGCCSTTSLSIRIYDHVCGSLVTNSAVHVVIMRLTPLLRDRVDAERRREEQQTGRSVLIPPVVR